MLRATLALAVLAFMPAASAFAQDDLKPENKVGPVSFHPWIFNGGELPKAGEEADGPEVPKSTAVGAAAPLLLQTSYIGRESAEPTMGVDGDGVGFYAAGAFDNAVGQARTEIWRSTDGGVTWHEKSPSAAGVVEYPPATLDPYVYVDQITNRVYSIDLEGLSASFLAYTDDQGESWTPSAMSAPGANDHQTFFTGPPPAENPVLPPSINDWPTIAYYCVNALSHVGCSRSTDGGLTFTELPSTPFVGCLGCQTGHGVVDSEGRVFLPRGTIPGAELLEETPPQVAISSDAGMSWETVDVAPAAILPSGRHTAVAVDKADNVYYVWWDDRFQLPWLAISTDHGATWGKPMMVAPPGVHDANFPMVVAGDPGRVAISFPGSSVDAPGDTTRPWHAWMVVSENALAENPVFHANIGDTGNDPLHRGVCDNRCGGMYDFIDLQLSPKDGSVWGTFTDTCTSENKCSTTRDKSLATDMQGVAVRTVGSFKLLGNAPGASSLGGGPVGGPATTVTPSTPPSNPRPADSVRPKVKRLTLKGRKLSWSLSERASAVIKVKRGKTTVASFETGRPAKTGSLTIKKLKRGRYTIAFTAVDTAGNRSRAATKRLRIR